MTPLRPRRAGTPASAGARAPWGWAALGALIGLVGVLTTGAPARWLAAGLTQASGGMVELSEPEGSLWSGSARLLLTGGAGSHDRAALPGRVRWRIAPALTGLTARVDTDCCTPEGALALGLSPRWGGARLVLGDGRSLWPADLLSGLGTPWNTLGLEGELALATRALRVDWVAGRMQLTGQAELTVRQLASRLSTLRPLGSYQLQVTGDEAVRLGLSTLEGGLRVSCSGQWVGQRLRFNGEAQAAPGLEAQLANLLNLLGRRAGDRVLISLG